MKTLISSKIISSIIISTIIGSLINTPVFATGNSPGNSYDNIYINIIAKFTPNNGNNKIPESLNKTSNFSVENTGTYTEAQKQKHRAKLKTIFQETKQIANRATLLMQAYHGINPVLTQQMKQNTHAYHTRKNGNLLCLDNQREFKAPSSIPPSNQVFQNMVAKL